MRSFEPLTQGSDGGSILSYVIIAGVVLFFFVIAAKIADGLASTDDKPKEED